VIRMSATHAEQNHTRAGAWSSGLRENSRIVATLTDVPIPPAEIDLGWNFICDNSGIRRTKTNNC